MNEEEKDHALLGGVARRWGGLEFIQRSRLKSVLLQLLEHFNVQIFRRNDAELH